MGNQIAKLFLRGSLPNITARNLTEEQKQEVTDLIEAVMSDSAVRGPIIQFCSALGGTIRNEYKDYDVGTQDARIAFWMAAVDALFHRHKKLIKGLIGSTCGDCNHLLSDIGKKLKGKCLCGSENRLQICSNFFSMTIEEMNNYYSEATGRTAPERDRSIATNRIQRQKFFKTYLFNYLRQIIRENKFPQIKAPIQYTGPADEVIFMMMASALSGSANNNYEIDIHNDVNYLIKTDTNLLSIDDLTKINDVKKFAERHGVSLEVGKTEIAITTPSEKIPIISGEIVTKSRIHHISLNGFRDSDDNDNSMSDHLQSKSDKFISTDDTTDDSLDTVRSRLCEMGKKIVAIYSNPPRDYVNKFGGGPPKKTHITAYLHISQKELKKHINIIRMQMVAIDMVP